jgi:hypothetical protein
MVRSNLKKISGFSFTMVVGTGLVKGRMEKGGCSRNEGMQEKLKIRPKFPETAPSKVIIGSKKIW